MIRISPGSKQDCQVAFQVMQTAFAPYLDKLEPQSGVFRETAASLQAKLDTHTLLLAKDDENVVGCVFFTPVNETDVYFGRLSVLPAYQNQGIASQLLACVEAYAADNGYKRVTLAVRIVLADNVRYFQSLGYQITSKESHEGFTEPTYYTMAKMITLP